MKRTPEKVVGTFASMTVVGIIDLACLWEFGRSSTLWKTGGCALLGACAVFGSITVYVFEMYQGCPIGAKIEADIPS